MVWQNASWINPHQEKIEEVPTMPMEAKIHKLWFVLDKRERGRMRSENLWNQH